MIKNFKQGPAGGHARRQQVRNAAMQDEVWRERRLLLIAGEAQPTEDDLHRLYHELIDEYLSMDGDGDIPDHWPESLQDAMYVYRNRADAELEAEIEASVKPSRKTQSKMLEVASQRVLDDLFPPKKTAAQEFIGLVKFGLLCATVVAVFWILK